MIQKYLSCFNTAVTFIQIYDTIFQRRQPVAVVHYAENPRFRVFIPVPGIYLCKPCKTCAGSMASCFLREGVIHNDLFHTGKHII